MNGFQAFLQQLAQVWRGMSTMRRIALVVAVGTILAVAGIVWYFSQTEYRVLYSGLSIDDAGTVTGKLQAQNIPFKLGAGGTAVLVPADQVQQARVSLAGEGMAFRGGKGFEIFDDSSLGMTPFVQNVNYNRALQAELARSIGQMEPIASARVHIVRPESSAFVRDQKPTTASVMLKLKPGATLNRSTAQAITALVSHAVEGLTDDSVTLVDASNGRLLSDMRSDVDGTPSTQLEYRRQLEDYLASKAEELLGKSLGYGKAIIKVTADVNFKRVKEKKETYSPEDRVAVSERVTNSNTTSGGAGGARGVAGAGSNTGRSNPAAASGGGNAKEETVQTDYLVSKTVREFEDKLGNIERLTIAAMVDLSGGGETPSTLSMEEVRKLIKQAVGFKQGRDDIEVSNMKLPSLLPPEEPDEDAAHISRWQAYIVMARNGAFGLSAVLALVLGFLFLRRMRRAPAELAPAPVAAANPGESIEAVLNEITIAARQDPATMVRLLAGMMGP